MQLIWLSPIPEQIHQSSTQSGCCFSDWKYSFNLIQKQKMFYEKQTYLSWQEFFLLSSGICWWRRSSFLNLGFLFCWTSSPSSSSSSPSSSSSSWLLAPVSSTLFSPDPDSSSGFSSNFSVWFDVSLVLLDDWGNDGGGKVDRVGGSSPNTSSSSSSDSSPSSSSSWWSSNSAERSSSSC